MAARATRAETPCAALSWRQLAPRQSVPTSDRTAAATESRPYMNGRKGNGLWGLRLIGRQTMEEVQTRLRSSAAPQPATKILRAGICTVMKLSKATSTICLLVAKQEARLAQREFSDKPDRRGLSLPRSSTTRASVCVTMSRETSPFAQRFRRIFPYLPAVSLGRDLCRDGWSRLSLE